METPIFKLDRTAFRMQTHQQSSHQLAYWLSRPIEERLAATMYLNSIVYGFDINNPPRMDKTIGGMRKRS